MVVICKSIATSVEDAIKDKTAYKTQVSRNENIAKLQAGYLFPEIRKRVGAHKLKYPDAKMISLGLGDTTQPIPEVISSAMAKRALALSTIEGYSGYGAEKGEAQLRARLASTFYSSLGIDEDDIFVSDGAKCGISRIQALFGPNVTMAVQSPAYPAYVDSSVIMGQTGEFQKDVKKYATIEYMECTPENDFFPDLSKVSRTDVIFFCSPNNPTGYAASREQLISLVRFAKNNGSIIVYDSAYAMYASDDTPRSIFEIPGAKEAMHEMAGFYKENTQIILNTFKSLGFKVYGGKDCPYVWVHFPGQSSWDVFNDILEKTNVVTLPGNGFGPGGEGFIRVSGFGHRNNVLEACQRFKKLYKLPTKEA